MSGSGNGSWRSYAAFSAFGKWAYHDGNRVFCEFMQPHMETAVSRQPPPQTASRNQRPSQRRRAEAEKSRCFILAASKRAAPATRECPDSSHPASGGPVGREQEPGRTANRETNSKLRRTTTAIRRLLPKCPPILIGPQGPLETDSGKPASRPSSTYLNENTSAVGRSAIDFRPNSLRNLSEVT